MTKETEPRLGTTTPGALNQAARDFMKELEKGNTTSAVEPEPLQDVPDRDETTVPPDDTTSAPRAAHIVKRLRLIPGGDGTELAMTPDAQSSDPPHEEPEIDLSQPLSAGNLAFPAAPEGPLEFKPPEDLYDPAKQERPTA